jgi:Domain of unknown function (DUF4440)
MRLLLLNLILATTSLAQTGVETSRPTTAEIQTQEEHVWATWAAGDYTTFRAFLLPTYLNVEDHILNRDDTMAFIQQCKVDSYKISNLQVRPLGPDSALSVYHINYSLACTFGGKPQTLTSDSNVSSIWVRSKDSASPNAPAQWRLQSHFETPAAKP